ACGSFLSPSTTKKILPNSPATHLLCCFRQLIKANCYFAGALNINCEVNDNIFIPDVPAKGYDIARPQG
ncbi:MAG: hypothetical protein P9M00_12900, partial [Candidatus Tritonobacter lacicola]|nr:hypothetical protein [Candidatus Tritonobacter lacicola]